MPHTSSRVFTATHIKSIDQEKMMEASTTKQSTRPSHLIAATVFRKIVCICEAFSTPLTKHGIIFSTLYNLTNTLSELYIDAGIPDIIPSDEKYNVHADVSWLMLTAFDPRAFLLKRDDYNNTKASTKRANCKPPKVAN